MKTRRSRPLREDDHRLHPADLRIEAWGPTREGCIAEAVRGLVDSFAVVTGRPPHVMFLVLARAADAEITGAVPKAASLRGLRCAPDPAGRWSCAVTVEV